MSLVAAMGLVTACVDSSEEDAQTPAGSPTVANSALQTNSKGETITAPSATAPADTSGGGATPPAAGAGDAAAGATFFAGVCTSCHLNNGKDAGGIGPKLAAGGYDLATIKNQITNGGGAMPAGLATGADFDNVVAYVVSLQ